MKQLLLIALLFTVTASHAQELLPNWYVLEKGASVGILKPGINDLIAHLGASKTGQINRDEINKVFLELKKTAETLYLDQKYHQAKNKYIEAKMIYPKNQDI